MKTGIFDGSNADAHRYAVLGYILGAAALTIVLVVALSLSGAAGDDELLNETAEFEENDTLEIEVTFNETLNETETFSVDLVTYNETEFSDENVTHEPVFEAVIEGGANETVNETWDINETAALEAGVEYRLLVHGNETEVDDVYIPSDLIGAPIVGDDVVPGFGVGVALVALLVSVAVARVAGET